MPSQLIPFKVIKSPLPSDYEYNRDVIGVEIPLFFYTNEESDVAFSYIPFEFRLGLIDDEMVQAVRENINKEAIHNNALYTATKDRRYSADISRSVMATMDEKEFTTILSTTALLSRPLEFVCLQVNTADWNRAYDYIIHTTSIEAETNNKQKDVTFNETLFADILYPNEASISKEMKMLEAESYRESIFPELAKLADMGITKKESALTWLLESIREVKQTSDSLKPIYADAAEHFIETIIVENISAELLYTQHNVSIHEAISAESTRNTMNIVKEFLLGFKINRNSRLKQTAIDSDKNYRGALNKRKEIQSLRDNHVALPDKQWKKIFAIREPHNATKFKALREIEKQSRDSLLHQFKSWAGRKFGRNAHLEKLRREDVIRQGRNSHLDREKLFINAEAYLDGLRHSGQFIQTISAILDYRDGYIQKTLLSSKKKRQEGLIDDNYIFNGVDMGSKEAVLQRVFLEMKKADVTSEFLKLLSMDTYLREAKLFDKLMADGKGPGDSLIEQIRLYDKNEKYSLFNKIIQMVKAPKNSGWVQEVIGAVMGFETRQLVIEYLKDSENISPEGLLSHLKTATEAKELEAIESELELGWNKDKPNRPAGLMTTNPLGHWDIGWDDVMDQWEEGIDYLDPPSTDYDYDSNYPNGPYNKETGEPYKPMSSTSIPDVIIEPIKHPFPEWADIGREECWVEIFTFQDVIINILGIQRENKLKIAGMTTVEGLQFILRELYLLLEKADVLTPQYQRMFRFVRWYAETLSMQEMDTVLKRVYEDWTESKDASLIERVDAVKQSDGATYSLMTEGSISLTIDLPVDTTLSLSIAVKDLGSTVIDASSLTGSLNVMDAEGGVLWNSDESELFTNGAIRLTLDVKQGPNVISLNWQDLSTTLITSGWVVNNSIFSDATIEYVEKDSKSSGLKATDMLVYNLTDYYVNHHLNKKKGAVGVKQRKIWLT